MPNASLGFIADPLTVRTNVSGETFGAFPYPNLGFSKFGEDRFLAAELRGNFDQSLVDEDSNWVEVGGDSFESKALGLQWDGSTTGEGIDDGRRMPTGGVENLLVSFSENVMVVGVFPQHELLDQRVQFLSAPQLVFFGWVAVGVSRRIVHELGE